MSGRLIAFAAAEAYKNLRANPNQNAALEALERRGHAVVPAIWDDPAEDWSRYDLILLRTTWDYHLKAPAYRAWLQRLKAQALPVFNDPDLVLWNLDKHYLVELGRKGVTTIPTQFIRSRGEYLAAESFLEQSGSDSFILKPAMAAGGYENHRLARGDFAGPGLALATRLLDHSALLLQPYIPAVGDGEWSLIFYGGRFSHAVLKTPAADDYRVQSQFGGRTAAQSPPLSILAAAQRYFAALPSVPLYARADIIAAGDAAFLVEFELNEPGLFESFSPIAADNFADAVENIRVRTQDV